MSLEDSWCFSLVSGEHFCSCLTLGSSLWKRVAQNSSDAVRIHGPGAWKASWKAHAAESADRTLWEVGWTWFSATTSSCCGWIRESLSKRNRSSGASTAEWSTLHGRCVSTTGSVVKSLCAAETVRAVLDPRSGSFGGGEGQSSWETNPWGSATSTSSPSTRCTSTSSSTRYQAHLSTTSSTSSRAQWIQRSRIPASAIPARTFEAAPPQERGLQDAFPHASWWISQVRFEEPEKCMKCSAMSSMKSRNVFWHMFWTNPSMC